MVTIDLKIIQELDKDPRISVAKLARKINISQQVVDYRVKRLTNTIIRKFGTIINLSALGLQQYRIFFSFTAHQHYSDNDLLSYLKKQKGVYWSARVGGRYDLLLVLSVHSFQEYEQILTDFYAAFPDLIRDMRTVSDISHHLYKHRYLVKDYSELSYGIGDAKVELDDIDYQILHYLKDNCRISSVVIGRELGVTYKTILNRIKKLEQQKVILGYRLFMQYSSKEPFILLFSFRNYSIKDEKNLFAHLQQRVEVSQALRLFGIWGIFLNVRAKDNQELQQFIISLRDSVDMLDQFEIIPIFKDISINLMPV